MNKSETLASIGSTKPWSERRNGRITVAAGMVALFLLVFWLALTSRRMLSEAPALVVDEQYLLLGKVWEDPGFVWTIPIRNTTNEGVRIAGFQASCYCVRIEPPSIVIPAKGTREVRLTIDLTRGERMVAEQTKPASLPAEGELRGSKRLERDFSVHVFPHAQDILGRSIRILPWTVHGRVFKALSVIPPSIFVGDSLIHGQPRKPQTATVYVHTALQRMTAICDPPLASVELNLLPGRDDAYLVKIQPKNTIPVGRLMAKVFLQPITNTGTALPPVPIPVEGQVVTDIRATPEKVLFGACSLGETLHETVTLHSSTGSTFEVEGIECDSHALMVQPQKVASSCKVYRITQRIEKLSDQFTTVRFKLRQERGASTMIVPVSISYLGTSP